MAKWVRSGVLDSGLNDIKNNAVIMLLLSTYTAGDSYATVVANKLNAGVSMAPADFVLSSSGNNRLLTTASGKTQAASATVGAGDRHLAFTDGAANVIWVTDETTDQAITTGNTINFPSLVYTSVFPT